MYLLTSAPSHAIQRSATQLFNYGSKVESKSWQSIKGEFDTLELFNHTITFPVPFKAHLAAETQANLPWADEHFEERVSGIPYNPPPSHVRWPFAQKSNGEHIQEGRFSHTYPERMWSNTYGNLDHVVQLLDRDETTRQAFLPIWWAEDTGALDGQRVPCTLGYLFMIRHGYLHMIYYIRSCDIVRHFQDDIYMALRLMYWVNDQLKNPVLIGTFTMHIGSLHCFVNDKAYLLKLWKN